MAHRDFKNPLYAQFARIGHAVSTPKRIELLDLLSQGEKTVEQLAAQSDTPRRLRELPKSREVIAYCRGPYCVYSLEAVTLLRKRGYRARRAEEGFPDWRARGLPVARGADSEDDVA